MSKKNNYFRKMCQKKPIIFENVSKKNRIIYLPARLCECLRSRGRNYLHNRSLLTLLLLLLLRLISLPSSLVALMSLALPNVAVVNHPTTTMRPTCPGITTDNCLLLHRLVQQVPNKIINDDCVQS